jgi:hypothetical protein
LVALLVSVAIELWQNDGDQYAKDNLHIDRRDYYRRGFDKWLLCGGKRIDIDITIDGADDRFAGEPDRHDRHEHRHSWYRNG